jgi:hypothetical protein
MEEKGLGFSESLAFEAVLQVLNDWVRQTGFMNVIIQVSQWTFVCKCLSGGRAL